MSEKFYKLVDGILWADIERPYLERCNDQEMFDRKWHYWMNRPHYPLSGTLEGKERYELGVDFEVRKGRASSITITSNGEEGTREVEWEVAIPIAQPVVKAGPKIDIEYVLIRIHEELLLGNYQMANGIALAGLKEIKDRPPKNNSEDVYRWVKMVFEWHHKFGVDIGEIPKMLQPARFEMRHRILQEEIDELQDAFWMKDKGLPEIADAICDILYVIIGTAIEFGLHEKLDELFTEVHRSNMSKLDENGNPVKREDGKILKSKLFSPPDLKSIIFTESNGLKK